VLAASGYPRLTCILLHLHRTPPSSIDETHGGQEGDSSASEQAAVGGAAAGGSRDLLMALGWLMARGGVLNSTAPAPGGAGAGEDERGVGTRRRSQTSCAHSQQPAFARENMRVGALVLSVCLRVSVRVSTCIHTCTCISMHVSAG
jgi:hypothetical protein